MHVEYLETTQKGQDGVSPLEAYVVDVPGDIHNANVTRMLCAASMWAYADLGAFATVMGYRGLYGEFVGINVRNDACLVDTTVYLFLSHSRKLGILTFRGTEPTNIINWLSNASTNMLPQEEGSVHAGFLNASIAILPILMPIFEQARGNGCSLYSALCAVKAEQGLPDQVFSDNFLRLCRSQTKLEAKEKAEGEDEGKGKGDGFCLLACGHSLGGAFAAMAGAIIHLDPSLGFLRDSLRSIYTFGAPMFCDKTFAEGLDAGRLGDVLFRHRYKNDIVPVLPTWIQGEYQHFGRSYIENRGTWVRVDEGRWLRALRDYQVFGAVGGNVIGVLAWFKNLTPALEWIPFPVSWGDHFPLNYMRTSQAPLSGREIIGVEAQRMLDHGGRSGRGKRATADQPLERRVLIEGQGATRSMGELL